MKKNEEKKNKIEILLKKKKEVKTPLLGQNKKGMMKNMLIIYKKMIWNKDMKI